MGDHSGPPVLGEMNGDYWRRMMLSSLVDLLAECGICKALANIRECQVLQPLYHFSSLPLPLLDR